MKMRMLSLCLSAIAIGGSASCLAADTSRCHGIPDDRERLACYDDVTGYRTTAAPVVPLERQPESRPTVEREAQFGLAPEKAAAPEHLAATLASVRRDAYGKLTLVLSNEQVWRQLDSARLPLRKGDAVVIREASLGSHLLEKADGSRPIRVKRLQ